MYSYEMTKSTTPHETQVSPNTTDSTSTLPQSTFEESTISMIDVTSETPSDTAPARRRKKRPLNNQQSEGISDFETDYYEEDENNSEEANWNSEKTPNETGEVFNTVSSEYVYGSAFVGTVIFSLINLRKYNVVYISLYQ